MTDHDLNFLVGVIGSMLAVFWVIGRSWLAIMERRPSSASASFEPQLCSARLDRAIQ